MLPSVNEVIAPDLFFWNLARGVHEAVAEVERSFGTVLVAWFLWFSELIERATGSF
jgi:hypothetical protein